MKLEDAIKTIDTSKICFYTDLEQVLSDVGLADFHWLNYKPELKIGHEYFSYWTCTDTHVGHGVYFVDYGNGLEAFAYTYQAARKSDKRIYWIGGEEMRDRIQKHILDYIKKIQYDDVGSHYNIGMDDDIILFGYDGETLKLGHNGRR